MSTPYALYHNWLDKWLYCFKQNADYKAYCIAKEMGDAVTCEQFEAKYERIADLYADWGDIRNIVFRGQSETFKLWRGERSKLFLQLDMVRWIENPAEYEHRAGHALIEVPLFEKKNDTLASLEKHIDFVYKMRKRAVEDSSKESVRLIHGPLPQPKYTLHGDFNKATKGSVRKAIYVAMYRRIRKDGLALSQTDIVIAAMQDLKNPFKWAMTESDKVAHERGTFKKSLFNGSKVKMLARAGQDFDALVRNTIHGRFPDFR